MHRTLSLILCPLLFGAGLSACATAPVRNSGQLSSYDGLTAKEGTLRAKVSERRNALAPDAIRRVAIEPPQLVAGPDTDWMSEDEKALMLREVAAQLCFELTERFDLAAPGETPDARVRAWVTRVKPTGKVGSTMAAAAGFFIPGPIGLRVPGTLGGFSGEAEMVDGDGRQIAATVWARNATAVGADNPSLSRIGDALQFVEPFADDAAKVMTPDGFKGRPVPTPDPCAEYGPRLRPEGWLAKFATGLYVPQLSGARGEAPR
jgi:hypothetical protein